MPNSERPSKVIMGLGIATVVLLSANLISVLAQRVWPGLQDLALWQSLTQTEEVAPESAATTIHIRRLPHNHTVVSLSPMNHRRHRCSKLRFETAFDFDRNTVVDFGLDTQLDLDIDRLEREIERETSRLERELSTTGEDLGAAITLRLLLDGEKALVLNQKADLAELKEKISKLTHQFEIRVREHEAAAEKARIVVKELEK